MDLKELVTLYRRWFWLILMGAILGLIGGGIISKLQTPVYEASSKVLIARSRQESSADILALSDQQLVLTYQQLLKTQPVLSEVESRLGIIIDPIKIQVDVLPNTQIIEIKVQDSSAAQAASIANTLVQILIEQNETLQAGRYAIYEESLNSQIIQVQAHITNLQSQITQINRANVEEQLVLVNKQITDLKDEVFNLEKDILGYPAILSPTDRATLAEKQSQISQLRSLLYLYQQIQTNLTFIGQPVQGGTSYDDPQLTNLESTLLLYQELYLNLLNNLERVRLARVQSTPAVSQIENASVPEKPERPMPVLYTTLSGMVGLLIAAGAVLLMDYFDDTFKSSQKIREILGVPVIGEIARIDSINKVENFNSLDQTDSSVLNAFGILRINVNRLIQKKSLRTILVTGPALGEGKTTIAANLAMAFARAGRKVVLLDTDMYHPTIHSRFGLDNKRGLTNILTGDLDWQDVALDFDGITVITSGVRSVSSTALLESQGMDHLLEKLQKEADIIIIDGPPMFIADSQVLALKVDGILLVVRQGDTITAVARAMLDQLKIMDAHVIGVVLNCIPRTDSYYFDGYYRIVHKDKNKDMQKEVEVDKS